MSIGDLFTTFHMVNVKRNQSIPHHNYADNYSDVCGHTMLHKKLCYQKYIE